MKRLIAPNFISQQVFDKLKIREQKLIVILYENRVKKYSKEKIMALLCIDSIRTFQRLQKTVREIIKRHFVT
jgi:hypothetical protein